VYDGFEGRTDGTEIEQLTGAQAIDVRPALGGDDSAADRDDIRSRGSDINQDSIATVMRQ
jgi:hypothetical protein